MAERFREVRRRAGDPERDNFALALGVPVSTLAGWERGDAVPDANALALYRERLNVDLDWLLFGTEPHPSTAASAPVFDQWLLSRIVDRIARVYRAAGVDLPPVQLGELAAEKYGEIAGADRDEWPALIDLMGVRLKKAITQAEPGSGKASA